MEKLNRIIESYPPELKLLLVFCGSERWSTEELLPIVTWDVFLTWVKRHRVTPAVYRYIKKNPAVVPEEVANTIEQRFEKITKRNLLLAGEVIQICKALESKGIQTIPLKGIFLSKQLYNNYNYRETRDIDILVDYTHIPAAIPVLHSLGYLKKKKKTDDFSKSSFQFVNHHVVLNNTEKRTSLEMHWRLFVFESIGNKVKENIFQNAGMDSETQVRLANIDDHMDFVVMHGHHHWWHALQWVMDVEDYVKTKNPVIEPDDTTGMSDIYYQTICLTNLLFSKQCSSFIFTRKKQRENIKNSLRVLGLFKSETLINPLVRLRRIGLFFDLNRNNKGFWKIYLKYFWLKLFY